MFYGFICQLVFILTIHAAYTTNSLVKSVYTADCIPVYEQVYLFRIIHCTLINGKISLRQFVKQISEYHLIFAHISCFVKKTQKDTIYIISDYKNKCNQVADILVLTCKIVIKNLIASMGCDISI